MIYQLVPRSDDGSQDLELVTTPDYKNPLFGCGGGRLVHLYHKTYMRYKKIARTYWKMQEELKEMKFNAPPVILKKKDPNQMEFVFEAPSLILDGQPVGENGQSEIDFMQKL